MTDLPDNASPRSTSEIASYHAHVYFDPDATRPEAERLRNWIDQRFPVTLGRWHDVKVGPTTRRCIRSRLCRGSFLRRWYRG